MRWPVCLLLLATTAIGVFGAVGTGDLAVTVGANITLFRTTTTAITLSDYVLSGAGLPFTYEVLAAPNGGMLTTTAGVATTPVPFTLGNASLIFTPAGAVMTSTLGFRVTNTSGSSVSGTITVYIVDRARNVTFTTEKSTGLLITLPSQLTNGMVNFTLVSLPSNTSMSLDGSLGPSGNGGLLYNASATGGNGGSLLTTGTRFDARIYFMPDGNVGYTSFQYYLEDDNGQSMTWWVTVSKFALAPTVVRVDSSSGDGFYGLGATIIVTVLYSQTVVVFGVPYIELNATNVRNATYIGGTGTATLSFQYVVAATDVTPLLDTRGQIILPGTAAIQNAFFINAQSVLPTGTTNGSLASSRTINVNSIRPVVTALRTDATLSFYDAGRDFNIFVDFSSPVLVVAGTAPAYIILNTAVTVDKPEYSTGSGTSSLGFRYVVKRGANAAILNVVSNTSLVLPSGTIQDAWGNDADLTLPVPPVGLQNIADPPTYIEIDSAPVVLTTTSSVADGYYGAGDSIDITLNWSEPINVANINVTLLMRVGTGRTTLLTYFGTLSSTMTMTFTYVPAYPDFNLALDYANSNALQSTPTNIPAVSGTIMPIAVKVLDTPGTNASSSLSGYRRISVDTILQPVTIGFASLKVGQRTTLNVTLAPTVKIPSNGVMSFVLPAGCDVPAAPGSGAVAVNGLDGVATLFASGNSGAFLVRRITGTALSGNISFSIPSVRVPLYLGLMGNYSAQTQRTDNSMIQKSNTTATSVVVKGDLGSLSATVDVDSANATTAITFGFHNFGALPLNGSIDITFPSAFTVLGNMTVLMTTLDGTLNVTVRGNVVTITRRNATTDLQPGDQTLKIGSVVNPTLAGTTATFYIRTYDSKNTTIEDGRAPGVNIKAGAASKLFMMVQPVGDSIAVPLIVAPVVGIQDAFGNNVTSENTLTVSVAIQNDAGPGATLSGTLVRQAVAGFVTFPGLNIDRPGVGYTLRFNGVSMNVTGVVSGPFNVTASLAINSATASPNATVIAGNTITYTLAVRNSDLSRFTSANITTLVFSAADITTLTPFLNGASSNITCTSDSFNYTCVLGALSPQTTVNVTLVALINDVANPQAVYRKTFTVSAGGSFTTFKQTVDVRLLGHVSIDAAAPVSTAVTAGTQARFTFTVSNHAAATSTAPTNTALVLTASHVVNGSMVSVNGGAFVCCGYTGNTTSCPIGTLAAGGVAVTVELRLMLAKTLSAAVYSTVVSALSNPLDFSSPSTLATQLDVNVAALIAISSGRALPNPVTAGNALQYTFTVTNWAAAMSIPTPVLNFNYTALVSSPLPVVVANGATLSCTLGALSISCTLPALAASASVNVTINSTVIASTAHTAPLTNMFYATGAAGYAVGTASIDVVVLGRIAISGLSVVPSTATAGDMVTLTIVLANNSTQNTPSNTSLTFSSSLLAMGSASVNGGASGACNVTNNLLVCPIGSLPANGVPVTVVVTAALVAGLDPASYALTGTVDAGSSFSRPATGATELVVAVRGLLLFDFAQIQPSNAAASANVTFNFTLSNRAARTPSPALTLIIPGQYLTTDRATVRVGNGTVAACSLVGGNWQCPVGVVNNMTSLGVAVVATLASTLDPGVRTFFINSTLALATPAFTPPTVLLTSGLTGMLTLSGVSATPTTVSGQVGLKYMFNVSNGAPTTPTEANMATNATFSAALLSSAGASIVRDGGAPTACTLITGNYVCPIGTIMPGTMAGLVISLTLPPDSDPTVFPNTIYVNGGTNFTVAATALGALTVNIQGTLNITAIAANPSTIQAGNAFNYTVTVNNMARTAATPSATVVTLPATNLASAPRLIRSGFNTSTCVLSAGVYSCTVGSLPIGSTNFLVSVVTRSDLNPPRPAGFGVLTVNATSNFTSPSTAPGAADVSVLGLLTIKVMAISPRPAVAGAPVAYTINVTNMANAMFTDVMNLTASMVGLSSDPLTASVDGGSTNVCTGGVCPMTPLAGGASHIVVLTLTPNEATDPGFFTQTFTATGGVNFTTPTSTLSEGNVTLLGTVGLISDVLTATCTAEGAVSQSCQYARAAVGGTTVTFSLRLRNPAPTVNTSTTTNVTVPSLGFDTTRVANVTINGGASIACQTITTPSAAFLCSVGAVPAANTSVLVLVTAAVQRTLEPQTISRTITISGGAQFATRTTSPSTAVDVRVRGLLEIQGLGAYPTTVAAGTSTTYNVTVFDRVATAGGLTPRMNLTFSMANFAFTPLPVVSLNSLVTTTPCVVDSTSNTAYCDVGTLSPLSQFTANIRVTLLATLNPQTFSLPIKADAGQTFATPIAGLSGELAITVSGGLAVVSSMVTPSTVVAGSNITYYVVLFNGATVANTPAGFGTNITVPLGSFLTSATGAAVSINGGAASACIFVSAQSAYVCAIGTIAANSSATVAVSIATRSAVDPALYTNTLTLAAGTAFNNPVVPPASIGVTIVAALRISSAMVSATGMTTPAPPRLGVVANETLTYALVVNNSAITVGATATASFSANLLVASTAMVSVNGGAATACSVAAGVISCALGTIPANGSVSAMLSARIAPATDPQTLVQVVNVTAGAQFTAPSTAAGALDVDIKALFEFRGASASPNPVVAGQSVTYTLPIFNRATTMGASGVSLSLSTASLMGGVTIAVNGSAATSCPILSIVATCTVGAIPAGGATTVVVTVTVVETRNPGIFLPNITMSAGGSFASPTTATEVGVYVQGLLVWGPLAAAVLPSTMVAGDNITFVGSIKNRAANVDAPVIVEVPAAGLDTASATLWVDGVPSRVCAVRGAVLQCNSTRTIAHGDGISYVNLTVPVLATTSPSTVTRSYTLNGQSVFASLSATNLTTTVQGRLTLTATAASATYAVAGATFTYVVSLVNSDAGAAATPAATLTVDASLLAASPVAMVTVGANPSIACTMVSTKWSCAIGPIAPSSTTTISLSVTTPINTDPRVLANTLAVDAGSNYGVARAALNVTIQGCLSLYNLAVAPQATAGGQMIAYTGIVRNQAATVATPSAFSNFSLPTGGLNASVAAMLSLHGGANIMCMVDMTMGVFSCPTGSLAASMNYTFALMVVLPDSANAGSLSKYIILQGGDRFNMVNATLPTVAVTALLQMANVAVTPLTAVAGDAINFTLTLSNRATGTVTPFTLLTFSAADLVTVPPPTVVVTGSVFTPYCILQPVTSEIQCFLGPINGGQTIGVTVIATLLDNLNPYNYSVVLTGSAGTDYSSPQTPPLKVNVLGLLRLSGVAAVPTSVVAGNTVTYNVVVTNRATSTPTPGAFTMVTFPAAGLSFSNPVTISVNGGTAATCTRANGTYTCPIGTILGGLSSGTGQAAALAISATIPAATNPATVFSKVMTITAGPQFGVAMTGPSALDITILGRVDLAITSVVPTTLVAGDALTYSLVLYNRAPNVSTPATTTVSLYTTGLSTAPAPSVSVNGSAAVACTEAAGQFSCMVKNIPANSSLTVVIYALTLGSTDPGTLSNKITAAAGPLFTQPSTADGALDVMVLGLLEFGTVDASPMPVVAGNMMTIAISAWNRAGRAATAAGAGSQISFSRTAISLTAAPTLRVGSTTVACFVPTTGDITCNLGAMPADMMTMATLSAVVDVASMPQLLPVKLTLNGGASFKAPQYTMNVTVLGKLGLSISSPNANAVTGGTVSFVIVVSKYAPAAMTSVNTTLSFPITAVGSATPTLQIGAGSAMRCEENLGYFFCPVGAISTTPLSLTVGSLYVRGSANGVLSLPFTLNGGMDFNIATIDAAEAHVPASGQLSLVAGMAGCFGADAANPVVCNAACMMMAAAGGDTLTFEAVITNMASATTVYNHTWLRFPMGTTVAAPAMVMYGNVSEDCDVIGPVISCRLPPLPGNGAMTLVMIMAMVPDNVDPINVVLPLTVAADNFGSSTFNLPLELLGGLTITNPAIAPQAVEPGGLVTLSFSLNNLATSTATTNGSISFFSSGFSDEAPPTLTSGNGSPMLCYPTMGRYSCPFSAIGPMAAVIMQLNAKISIRVRVTQLDVDVMANAGPQFGEPTHRFSIQTPHADVTGAFQYATPPPPPPPSVVVIGENNTTYSGVIVGAILLALIAFFAAVVVIGVRMRRNSGKARVGGC